MPTYDYLCVDCGEDGQRISGVDDHVAVCVNCDGIMLRTDEDIWSPLWEEQLRQQEELT